MSAADVAPNIRSGFRFRTAFLVVSVAFWLGSLTLPALIAPGPANTVLGFQVLLLGWLGPVGVRDGINAVGVLAWWANPFYLWALAKVQFGGKTPHFSIGIAVALSTLTMLVDSYAVNEVPVFAPVLAYGPGALLWCLAILGLAYVVARDAGYIVARKLIAGVAALFCVGYAVQLAWRITSANDAERERLPPYAAKRGFVCSARSSPLPITEQQPAIRLEATNKIWLDALRYWRVAAVQVGSIEYRRAPEGSQESTRHPFMTAEPVTVPARYTVRVEGGHPYVNRSSDDGANLVRLIVIDNHTKAILGELVHHRELNRSLGFCPSLNTFAKTPNEEAIRWLRPFIERQ